MSFWNHTLVSVLWCRWFDRVCGHLFQRQNSQDLKGPPPWPACSQMSHTIMYRILHQLGWSCTWLMGYSPELLWKFGLLGTLTLLSSSKKITCHDVVFAHCRTSVPRDGGSLSGKTHSMDSMQHALIKNIDLVPSLEHVQLPLRRFCRSDSNSARFSPMLLGWPLPKAQRRWSHLCSLQGDLEGDVLASHVSDNVLKFCWKARNGKQMKEMVIKQRFPWRVWSIGLVPMDLCIKWTGAFVDGRKVPAR